jgi:hypothetical protein
MLSAARRRLQVVAVASLLIPMPAFAQEPAPAPPVAKASVDTASAKTWLTDRDRIEAFIKTAAVVEVEELKIGVTRPKRMKLAPGGPVEYIAFKHVPPGRPAGYWESYRSEIGAYELDKLLGLNMVPPTVERDVKGERGAAVMWCSPTQSFGQLKGVPTPPAAHMEEWNRQLVRAKMFDNFIGNQDPNLGNWLVDPAWNLLLIDHTRAFTSDKELPHKVMDRWDGALWDKMKALTLESLSKTLQPWVGKGEIKAMLARRDRMQQVRDKLMAAKGPSAEFR